MTLLDRFLFDQTMESTEAHEAMLRIILGQENLNLLTHVQTEKELRTAPWLRSIRLDVYSLDQARTVYNTEMQAKQRDDLVKRSRYYQSLIDSSLLEPGSVSFNRLNNTCIIMITPFDLFGENRYVYTFVPCCREDKALELNDGAVRIFLNTRGTNDHEVSQELIDFLHYVENPCDELVEKNGSLHLKTIHYYVSKIKASEEMGVKYMQRWEEEVLMKQSAETEGVKHGMIISAQNLMRTIGMSAEQALSAIGVAREDMEEYMTLLKKSISAEK